MNIGVRCISLTIGFSLALGCLFLCTQAIAIVSNTFSVIYADEERGQLGLRGCGTGQGGRLPRGEAVIQSLLEKHSAPLISTPETSLT